MQCLTRLISHQNKLKSNFIVFSYSIHRLRILQIRTIMLSVDSFDSSSNAIPSLLKENGLRKVRTNKKYNINNICHVRNCMQSINAGSLWIHMAWNRIRRATLLCLYLFRSTSLIQTPRFIPIPHTIKQCYIDAVRGCHSIW